MKGQFFLTLCFVFAAYSSLTQSGYANSLEFKPVLENIVPEKTFIPSGFDNNDNVQVVITGNLPNTCYKVGPVSAEVDEKNKKVYIKRSVYHSPSIWCLQVLVPYTDIVNLGILSAGQYEVVALDPQYQTQKQGLLSVGEKSPKEEDSPDQYVYAPVQDVYVNSASGKLDVVLKGIFGSDCMEYQKTEVQYGTKNIIEILPITNKKAGCENKPDSKEFNIPVNINSPWKGQTLIYVRSLNGQSIAKVVDLH